MRAALCDEQGRLLLREPRTAQDGGALGFARAFSDGAKGGDGRREVRLFSQGTRGTKLTVDRGDGGKSTVSLYFRG